MEFQGGVRAAPDVKPAPQSSSIKPAAAAAGGRRRSRWKRRTRTRKEVSSTQSHLASMRAGNSVTLRMCVVILPATEGSFEEAQVASRWPTKQPSCRKNRRNSPRLSLSLTDKLLQSWHDDIAKALGLSLNGTGRIHGRQFPVGSWYHSEPVLSSSPT